MAAGALQNVIVCRPSASPAAPCGAGEAPVAVQAYVLDPASASFIDAAAQPYDYTAGSAFWATAFVFTLTLYIGSRIFGTFINLVR